ncbi:MAG: PAS domain-containing protein [Bacteroidia bacterium]
MTAVVLGVGGLWGWTLWRYQTLSERTALYYTLLQQSQNLAQEIEFLEPSFAANRLENFYYLLPPQEKKFFSELPVWVQQLRKSPSEEEKHNFLQFFSSSLASYIQHIIRQHGRYAEELRFLPVLGFAGALMGMVMGWGLFFIALRRHKRITQEEHLLVQNFLAGKELPLQAAQELRLLWEGLKTLQAQEAQLLPALDYVTKGQPMPALRPVYQEFFSALEAQFRSYQEEITYYQKTSQLLTSLSEVLKQVTSPEKLAQEVIRFFCREAEALQGAFFIRQGDVLILQATYAYDQEMLRSDRFAIGEGLIGQSAAEKRTFYVYPLSARRLPVGLVEASPKALLVLPLLFQAEVYGVIELVFMEDVPASEQNWLFSLGQNVAATLAHLLAKENLQKLLTEEKALRQALQAQRETLEETNASLRAAQAQLLVSQKELSLRIEALSQTAYVVHLNAEGEITQANERFLRALALTPSQVQGRPWSDFWQTEVDIPSYEEVYEQLGLTGLWSGTAAFRSVFQETLFAQGTLIALTDLEGRKAGFFGVFFDITTQRRSETQLRYALEQSLKQEEQLRQTAEELQVLYEEMQRTQIELQGQIAALNNAAIVAETDLQGRILRVNQKFLDFYGYTPEEVIGYNHRFLKSGHQKDEIFESLWHTISTGNVWQGELRNRAKEGSLYWVILTVTPVLDQHGKPIKFIGVSVDITAQKRQEEQLRLALQTAQQQEEELRRYTEQLQAAHEETRRYQAELRGQIAALHNAAIVAETNAQGIITFVNDAFCRISGYMREELLGETHKLVQSGAHSPEFYAQLWETLTREEVWTGIFQNQRKDGSFYWVQSAITPVKDARGKIQKYIAVSFDITEQVLQRQRIQEALQALQEAQAELQNQLWAVNNAALVFETDLAGNLLFANSAALLLWGCQEDIRGRNIKFLNSGHHDAAFWAHLWGTLQRGEVWSHEVLNRNLKGEEFWCALTITPARNAQGNIYKYIGVGFDITPQKRQALRIRQLLQEATEKEAALRSYTQQLEAIQKEMQSTQLELIGRINALNNAAIVSETDTEGRITFVNDEATYIWGYTRQELIGKPHSILRSPTHPPKFFERMWEKIQQGLVWRGEVENRAKDGTRFWVDLTVTPVLDQEGKPYKYIGVAFEITRQKLQAQRLKEALKEVHSALPLPFFITDKTGKILKVSPSFCQLTGYRQEELLGKTPQIFRSEQTANYIFMDLWATIGRGKAWQGLLYNRIAQDHEQPFVVYILPDQDVYIAVWIPAHDLLPTLPYASFQALEAELSQLRSQNESLQDQLYLRQLELEELYRLVQEYGKA